MHLALLTLSFPPEIGGVQTYLHETMRRLAAHTAVTIITPHATEPPNQPEAYRRLTIANGRAPIFWKTLRQMRPERVLVGHAHPQLLAAAWAYTRGHFATLTYGNDYLAAQQRWHRPLFNSLLGRSRPLLTITQANRQKLQSLGLPPAIVIYPGTDPTYFTPLPEAQSARPTILAVGRLVSRKGFDLALQAMSLIRPQFPDLRLEVVGDGPDRGHLEQLAQELGMSDLVLFHGRLPKAELLAAYRRAHLFVMPAREETAVPSMEGFGIVYLEASACGLPVIAACSGGAAEAVQDGRTGLLIPPNDAPALAQAVIRLLQDPAERQRLGANGRQWVLSEMTWDATAHKLAESLNLS